MNSAMFRRGRIDRFAARLAETADRGGRHHSLSAAGTDADEGLTELVDVSRRLEAIGPLTAPRPEFRARTRAILLERAAHELGAGPADERTVVAATGAAAALPTMDALRTRVRTTRTRAAVMIGVAAGAIALSGMSTASGGAMPGDALYTVKRSTERAQLALIGSDLGRGQLYLEFARTRLAEAKGVRDDPAAFSDVLDDMDGEIQLGVQLLTTAAVASRDAATLRRIGEFAANQGTELDSLAAGLAAAASVSAANRSTALLDSVRMRVHDLTTALPCLVDQPPADALGPQPICGTGAPREQPAPVPPDAPTTAGTAGTTTS